MDLCEVLFPSTLYNIVILVLTFCILKILEGIATVAVGLLAFVGVSINFSQIELQCLTSPFYAVMVDFPATASFLTAEERSFVISKKSNFI